MTRAHKNGMIGCPAACGPWWKVVRSRGTELATAFRWVGDVALLAGKRNRDGRDGWCRGATRRACVRVRACGVESARRMYALSGGGVLCWCRVDAALVVAQRVLCLCASVCERAIMRGRWSHPAETREPRETNCVCCVCCGRESVAAMKGRASLVAGAPWGVTWGNLREKGDVAL